MSPCRLIRFFVSLEHHGKHCTALRVWLFRRRSAVDGRSCLHRTRSGAPGTRATPERRNQQEAVPSPTKASRWAKRQHPSPGRSQRRRRRRASGTSTRRHGAAGEAAPARAGSSPAPVRVRRRRPCRRSRLPAVRASSTLWLRISTSMLGFSVRAVSTICAHAQRLRRRDDHHARLRHVGLDQRRRVGGVAQHRGLAPAAQLFDDLAVLVGNDVGHALRRQRRGNALPDAAVADDAPPGSSGSARRCSSAARPAGRRCGPGCAPAPSARGSSAAPARSTRTAAGSARSRSARRRRSGSAPAAAARPATGPAPPG